MLKTSLAFLAGVLAMAVVVYLAGARFAAPLFFAGIVAVFAPAIALLSSVPRLRAAARFLDAFADGCETTRHVEKSKPDQAAEQGEADPLTADVCSALVNQGVRENLALRIATEATKANRQFDPAYRAALLLVPKSRRAA